MGRHPARQPGGGAGGAGGVLAALGDVAGALRAGDRDWLLGFIGDAAGARARLRAAQDAGPAEPARLVVAIPNRPGAISEIATALGHAHINIEDLHLRPGPPDGEGELELVVDGVEAAREAVRLVPSAATGPRWRPR